MAPAANRPPAGSHWPTGSSQTPLRTQFTVPGAGSAHGRSTGRCGVAAARVARRDSRLRPAVNHDRSRDRLTAHRGRRLLPPPPRRATAGAFLLCGFLMTLAYAQQGDHLTAARWFERNRAACGPPGSGKSSTSPNASWTATSHKPSYTHYYSNAPSSNTRPPRHSRKAISSEPFPPSTSPGGCAC